MQKMSGAISLRSTRLGCRICPLEATVTDLARRLFGKATRKSVEQTVLAVIDLPLGAVRRHLVAGSELPTWLRDQLEAAVRTVLRVGKELECRRTPEFRRS